MWILLNKWMHQKRGPGLPDTLRVSPPQLTRWLPVDLPGSENVSVQHFVRFEKIGATRWIPPWVPRWIPRLNPRRSLWPVGPQSGLGRVSVRLLEWPGGPVSSPVDPPAARRGTWTVGTLLDLRKVCMPYRCIITQRDTNDKLVIEWQREREKETDLVIPSQIVKSRS